MDALVLVRARGLRKEYGKGEGLVRAVHGVDLDVAAGETLAVMGPSGCGKSTLLHLLGGLDRPSGGELWLNGRRTDQMGERALARMRRSDVGFVFQAFHLMDELTAKENVELPALLAGRPPRQRLFEVLHSSGMTLVIVTHDDRVASAADRMISMRDGAFVDELLTSGTTGNLADFARIGG